MISNQAIVHQLRGFLEGKFDYIGPQQPAPAQPIELSRVEEQRLQEAFEEGRRSAFADAHRYLMDALGQQDFVAQQAHQAAED